MWGQRLTWWQRAPLYISDSVRLSKLCFPDPLFQRKAGETICPGQEESRWAQSLWMSSLPRWDQIRLVLCVSTVIQVLCVSTVILVLCVSTVIQCSIIWIRAERLHCVTCIVSVNPVNWDTNSDTWLCEITVCFQSCCTDISEKCLRRILLLNFLQFGTLRDIWMMQYACAHTYRLPTFTVLRCSGSRSQGHSSLLIHCMLAQTQESQTPH